LEFGAGIEATSAKADMHFSFLLELFLGDEAEMCKYIINLL